MKALKAAGAEVDCLSVPGSLEIPTAIAIALDAAQRRRRPYDGAVALGCVIRGDTIHFEIVSHQSARGLMELSIARRLPIGNGIITVDTEAQAWVRALLEKQDKGGDAARAALALVGLKRRLGKH
jgi:6,7-dimethyl-8-ribityllumazine synthase